MMPEKKLGAVDVRRRADHPGSLLYYGHRTTQSVLVDLPLNRGYSLEAFPLGADGPHPFVRAVRSAEDADENGRDAMRAVLRNYYETVQPESAAEWLGLKPEEVPAQAAQPCWARLMPWDADTLEERRRTVRTKTVLENGRQGEALPIEAGWKICGPVRDDFLELQTERLYSLYRSIKSRGFVRDDGIDGDVRAKALVDEDGTWRWLQCGGGYHRVAVASALGRRRIPVRIWRVVFRREVDLWPQVVRGAYSRSAALTLFDRIVAGRVPPVVRPWARSSTKNPKEPAISQRKTTR